MSMMSSVLHGTGWAARKAIVAVSLGSIGIAVGIACVLLPTGIPFGIVGLATLVLLWTMPDLQTVPSRLARRALAPLLVVSSCVPYYIAIILPGVPFISARKLALYVFVGAFAITLCGSSANRRSLVEKLKQCPALFYAAGGYYLLTLVTLPLSVEPTSTLASLALSTTAWYLPLLGIVMFVETAEDIVRVLKVLVLCVLIDSVTGGIEFYLQHPFLARLLPSETVAQLIAANPFFAGMINPHFRFGEYRAISAFSNALIWGEMVGMTAPIVFWLIVHPRSVFDRLLGLTGLVAVILSLHYANSRGGWTCSVAAFGSFTLVWAVRHYRLRPEGLFGGIMLFLAATFVATGAMSIMFVDAVRIRLLGGGATQVSDDGRTAQWAIAWPKFFESPVWGHGFGTGGGGNDFATAYGQATIDDYRINVLLDSGSLGFALYFGMVAIAILISLRIYISDPSFAGTIGAALGCGLLAYAVDCTVLSSYENHTFLYTLIGLVFALHRITRRDEKAVAQARRSL